MADATRSSAIASRRADPSPTTWSWPTKSSRLEGRKRWASGATSARRSSAASAKRSLTPEVCSAARGEKEVRVAFEVAASTHRKEVVELLQALLRLDTVNPPGNETRAAELLRDYLEQHGVECELHAREPGRANLVARIRGRGDGKRLLLLSHTDTVLADPAEWTVDPWSGELRDGAIWGRGALDMKSQVAANAVAIATLAREGFEPAGDLIFAATADEEVGDDFGLSWLCREHPDAVRADYALNEGAGERFVFGGRAFYTCASAEKMSAPFRLRVWGRSGHASMPAIADNALITAARLIERLAELEFE